MKQRMSCLCLHPETNKVSSAQANNLSTGSYAIYITCLSVLNNVAVAAKKSNKWKWGASPFTCLSW